MKTEYAIKTNLKNPTITIQRFSSKTAAEKWAKWNYKGRGYYKIVKIIELTPKLPPKK